MKIICVDNYDREIYDDQLVAENVNKHYGKIIVDFLNKKEGKMSEDFYELVENDYKLYNFEP